MVYFFIHTTKVLTVLEQVTLYSNAKMKLKEKFRMNASDTKLMVMNSQMTNAGMMDSTSNDSFRILFSCFF